MEFIKPIFSEENIPVVLSCSDWFIPYAAGTIRSLMDHSSPAYNYDIIFFHTGISENNQQLMQTIISGYSNFSLRFLKISDFFKFPKLAVRAHFSVETFYRLTIPWTMPDYQKVIYLDSDVIILHDLADLFAVEIGNHLLAAVNDADVVGLYNGAKPEAKQYYDNVLKLQDPYSYFQTGVLLLNLDAFRKAFAPYELIESAAERAYHYVDQDVLNVECAGRTYPLDMNWNVLTDCGGERINTIKFAPSSVYQIYMESRKNPYIIHYAGWEKPWNNPQSDFADMYWKYARQTPFYELVLQRMMRAACKVNVPSQPYQSRARKLSDKLLPKGSRRRNFAKKLMPKGSRRWNFCKKIYYKIFKR